MSTEDEETKPLIVAHYRVGYCKPPIHTRFEKGKSGNPRGAAPKPRAVDELNRVIMGEAYRAVTVRQGQRTTRMPAIAAIFRSLLGKALKGSGPAQRAALGLVRSIEGAATDAYWLFFKSALEYKRDAEREIARRKKAGIKDFSDIVPHPDDVLVDAHTGQVHFAKELMPKDHAKLRKMGLKY
jgi:hypothetical protein